MEKFTKGEWRYERSEYTDGSWDGDYTIYAGSSFIAGISRSDVINEADFNAPLISVAPKMYALLDDFLRNYEFGDIVDAQIHALLSEARGEK